LLAHDVDLGNEVLAAFNGAVFRWLRLQAKQELGLSSVSEAHPAAVTVLHRASSHLALNPHCHNLVADGVWVQSSSSAAPVFRALPAPSRGDVMSVAWETCTKTLAALRRRGLWLDIDPTEDRFAAAEPGLAQCYAASIAGVLTIGPHAGRRVLRLGAIVGGADPEASTDEPFTPQGVTPGYGFSVHATRRVSGHDRAGLERLARYVTRPPLAQNRLKLLPGGDVLLELKRKWADGTTAVKFEALDFLAKLAALVFPPRTHRVRYQGAWARRSKLRQLVAPKPEEEESSAQRTHVCPGGQAHAHAETTTESTQRARRPRYDWAALLKRVWAIDVLACPRCQAPMQRIAWITRPDAIRKILASVGLPVDSPEPAPSRWLAQGELFATG
jgi:hypothetical protein